MDGAHVIDLSTDVAGASCARALATCGADVVQVEAPPGHPLRHSPPLVEWNDRRGVVSAMYEYLCSYKRGVALDWSSATGAAVLDRLLAGADIVLTSKDSTGATAAVERFRADNPRCVHVVTSPFGLTGPYADRPASALTDWAMSGYLFVTGDRDRSPVQGAGPWCGYAAGLTAAIGAIAASFHARRMGQGQLVDAGTMEAMAGLHQWSLVLYTHQGVVKRRAGNRHAESHHPVGFLACKDGAVCIGALAPNVWEAFCIAIDMPELLLDPRFATAADRFDNAEELDPLLGRWLNERTRDEIVGYLQSHRVLAGKVLTPIEALDDAQLGARRFWVEPAHLGPGARMPGLPFRLGPNPPEFRLAPRYGEHTREVLAQAGFAATEVTRLIGAGVVIAGGPE
jgi:crotonobetainyl-CoA:carnitine CoA-transferase CaiB-like acyl-CoA transferase